MTTLPPSHGPGMTRPGALKRKDLDRVEVSAIPGAGNETRTRDPNLGKVVLYQLSYSRRSELSHYRSKNGPVKGAAARSARTQDSRMAGQAATK